MSDAQIDDILGFWFGRGDEVDVEKQNKIWFGHDPQLDQEITRRFGGLCARAGSGELDDWAQTPRGRMALIILLDQFSRNIHRGRAEAFAHDPKARQLCLDGLEQGVDKQLRPIERAFFYLPLEHSEELELHDRCIRAYEGMLDDVPATARDKFKNYLDYAHMHRDIVVQFGRYPHRNRVLERESTPEEIQWLADKGNMFGQG